MIQVTKDSFFATVSSMNVHPRPIAIDGKWGLASEWERVESRRIIGKSTFRGHAAWVADGVLNDYFVTESFFTAHSSTLIRSEVAP